MARTLKVGTRGSPLALAQTELVLKKLRQIRSEAKFETVVIKTAGDRAKTLSDLRDGGKGLFVKEIEQALLKRKIDFAVHSAKDLPSTLLPGVRIAAVPEREDASDLFIGKTIDQIEGLLPGSLVGTSSLRRQAFLRAYYSNVVPVEMHGNLDTRFEKLRNPKLKLSGMVVAAAGVRRLKPDENQIGQLLPKDRFVPAAGQGALAIEVRENDAAMLEFLRPLDHEASATALRAERLMLARLEGGCQVPLGIHAHVLDDGLVQITACLASLDGRTVIRESMTGQADELESLTEALDTVLKSRGAADVLFSLPGRQPAKVSRNGHGRRARAKSRR